MPPAKADRSVIGGASFNDMGRFIYGWGHGCSIGRDGMFGKGVHMWWQDGSPLRRIHKYVA